MKYSKTVYIEVEAPDEDAADAVVYLAMYDVAERDGVTHVDFDGPIEEVSE